jgi:pimeloyl-ACP methyl ester carboxylesterase
MDTLNQPQAVSRFADIPTPWNPADSLRLHWLEWGDSNATRTAVCVHGLTRNAHDFDDLAAAMAADGWRVLALDIPGRGKSDWLKTPEHYAVPSYAAICLAWLASLSITQTCWIGTSMGGMIGMALAAMNPALIQKLVLNDVGPVIHRAGLERIQGYVGLTGPFPDKNTAAQMLRMALASWDIADASQCEHLIDHSLRQDGAAGWYYNYDPAIALSFRQVLAALPPGEDLRMDALWAMVQCPILLIRGGQSDLLTADDFAQACTAPHVRGYVVPNAGHAPFLGRAIWHEELKGWL